MSRAAPPDPKRLWQGQPAESNDMTLESLLEQAQIASSRVRRQFALPLILTLIATVFGTMRFVHSSSVWLWVLILAVLWAYLIRKAHTAYRVHRWVRPGDQDAEVALRDSLSFYRRELDREYQQAAQRFQPRAILATAVLLVGAIVGIGVARGGSLVNVTPILLILATWTVLAFYARRYETRRIRREIEELDRFEADT